MQLKDIGKVSDFVKAFNGLDKSLDFADQAQAIGSIIDDITDVADLNTFFKQIGASSDLATEAMKNSAQWAGTIGDIAEGAGDGAEAIAGLSEAAGDLGSATSGVSGFKLAWDGIKTSFVSSLPTIAAVSGALIALTAIGAGIYMWATEFDRAVDKAKESQEAYASTASEVQSLNSEIETTSARIAELESAGPITLTEKSELEQLKLQNAELERQYELKQKVAEKQSDEAVEDAMDALSKQRTYDITQKSQQEQLLESNSIWDRLVAGQMASQGSANTVYAETDIVTATKNEVDALNKLKDTREELILQRQNAKKDEKDAIDDQIDELDNEIDRYDTEIQTNLEDLESLRQNFIVESTNTVKSNLSSDGLDMYNQITDIIDAYTNTDKLKEQADALSEIWKDDSFAAAQQNLVDKLRAGQDISIDEITKDYPDLVKACNEAGISVEDLREELMALAQTETGMTALEEDFEQFKLQAVSAINSIDAINAALANSFSGKGLSIEYDEETGELSGDLINIANAYQNLEGYDAATLFEKTANGVHLNREALRALQAQQEAMQKSDFTNQQLALLQRYNDAVEELNNLSVGTDEYDAQQLVIDELSSQLELVNQLSAAYDGATSAYQKWLDAQSNGEDGDMYRSVSDTMIDRGKELYESGRYNTEEFRAIAQFYSNQDLSTASMEQVVKAYQASAKAINRYFTGDKEGIDNLIYDIQKKVPDAIQEVQDENGDVKLKFNLDDESVADALHISQEALQAILRGASEYTDSIVLGSTSNIEDLEAKLSEMSQKAEEAKTKLSELQSSGDISTTVDLDVDTSKLDEAGLEERIGQLTDLKEEVEVKFGADSSEVQYVNQLLEEAELRKEILEQQTNVSISVDIAGESDIDTLSQKLSSLPKDETSNVSINITDASQLDSVVNEIEQIPEDTPANISITVQDDDTKNTLDAKLAEIESKKPTIKCTVETIDNTGSTLDTSNETKTVTVNEVLGTTVDVQDETKTVTVNYTKGTQESPEDKNAKVNYDKGKQENPEKKNAIVDYDRGKQENPISPKTAIVNYKLGTVAKPPSVTVKVNYDTSGAPSGSGPANGTAHFYGTAFAQGTISGDWSLRQNEPNALINELGSEIVVRDGKWFVLNNGYPTFANLRKGDVVFNHAQSESLLKNGYVTGSHARLAYESSFVNGSAFSSGSWVFGNTGNGNLKGTGTKYTGSSTYNKSKDKSTKATEKATKATEKASKTVSDAADEFKEKFDEVEIKLDRMERSLQKLTDSIETYSYDLSKQSSVADQAMNMIRTDLTTLQQAYNRYIQEANSVGLSDDWKRRVENGEIDITTLTDENLADQIKKYQEYFEKALDVQDTIADYQSQLLDLATQKLDNIEQYFENRTNYNDEFGYLIDISTLQDALNKLTAELDKQVLAGVIKEGSNEWYEAMSKISEAQDALIEATLKKYQDIIDNLDRISTTLDNSLTLKEARGETITESDYQRPLEVANEQIDELYKKREKLLKQQGIYDVGSAKYDDYADQIADIDDEIYGLLGDIEDLKDKIWEVRWQPFFDGMEAAEDLRNEMDQVRDLLDSDAFVDTKGGLTSEGITNLGLISSAMNVEKQRVRDLNEAISKLSEDLNNGNISTSEYEEQLKDFTDQIYESTGIIEDYRDSIVSLWEEMITQENEVIQSSIDKHKELLQAKKDNDSYSRNVKDQTKEINQIQAQISALSGVREICPIYFNCWELLRALYNNIIMKYGCMYFV